MDERVAALLLFRTASSEIVELELCPGLYKLNQFTAIRFAFCLPNCCLKNLNVCHQIAFRVTLTTDSVSSLFKNTSTKIAVFNGGRGKQCGGCLRFEGTCAQYVRHFQGEEDPSRMHLSCEFIDPDGLYLLDVGSYVYVYVMAAVGQVLVKDLFGVDCFKKIDEQVRVCFLMLSFYSQYQHFTQRRCENRARLESLSATFEDWKRS
ncbi:unnamed protein product [Toxocara canis]|uniref:Uncharacterized protein n=1 Tax=Toxocara canis TaxID=6265 RepID=A0A3P7IP99_TOXCA|nr:unnamed protein product [Toxocara canis]